MRELIILTGISGAGKSTCMYAFEEMKYYCIENCPVPLFANLLDLVANGDEKYAKVAIAVNATDAEYVINLARDCHGISLSTIFLDTSIPQLLSRFKLTRHVHPLQTDGLSLEEAIKVEKEEIRKLRGIIDLFIDTTSLAVNDMRKILFEHYHENHGLTISFMSFGFKHGVPSDVDLMFDMRIIPNPFYIPELKFKTGNDAEVAEYVLDLPEAQDLIKRTKSYLDYYLDMVEKEGRAYFVVGIGCSGGQHRSVTIANHLARIYEKKYMTIVNHRDISRANN